MKKFEFKSQICTSVEQSKRLLELGLKKETADMHILNTGAYGWQYSLQPYQEAYNEVKYREPKLEMLPAWSLHRLIELLDQNISIDDFAIEQAYDTVIEYIAFDIRHNQFNHRYLEETICQQD